MLSLRIQSTLEREIVGQSRAVNTLTRALTVAVSGLEPAGSVAGSFLFLGPSGTGKTHMARVLARMLHEQANRLAVVDCKQLGGNEDLHALSRQMAPHFQSTSGGEDGLRAMPPYSIMLVEHVEAAKRELIQALLGVIEASRIILPDGQRGSLAGCLVLMTSDLCSGEIYGQDPQEIGFSTGALDLEEREKARIYEICSTAAEKRWGANLIGHLDDLIVFHRLRDHHFSMILDRQIAGLNRQLTGRGVRLDIGPEARAFLLARGCGFPQHGAWFLIKSFRRYVTFPLADLLADGLATGARVQVEVDGGERLRFLVNSTQAESRPAAASDESTIPIVWEGAPSH